MNNFELETGQRIQLDHGEIVTVARPKPEWDEAHYQCFIDTQNFVRFTRKNEVER